MTHLKIFKLIIFFVLMLIIIDTLETLLRAVNL